MTTGFQPVNSKMNFSATVKIQNGEGYLDYFFNSLSDYDRCNWKIVIHSFHSDENTPLVQLRSRNVKHENKLDIDQNTFSTLLIGDFREIKNIYSSGNCQLPISYFPSRLAFEVHDLNGKLYNGFQGCLHVELVYKKQLCH